MNPERVTLKTLKKQFLFQLISFVNSLSGPHRLFTRSCATFETLGAAILEPVRSIMIPSKSDQSVAVPSENKPANEPKKLKPCCACPDTKKPRDAW